MRCQLGGGEHGKEGNGIRIVKRALGLGAYCSELYTRTYACLIYVIFKNILKENVLKEIIRPPLTLNHKKQMGKWKRGRKGRKQKNPEVKLEFLS